MDSSRASSSGTSKSAMSSSSAVDYYDSVTSVSKQVGKALNSRSLLTQDSAKLVMVMVGLPGRGKSYISAKLFSFLSWQGYKTRVFNVGQHRRASGTTESAGALKENSGENSRAAFFDTSNSNAKKMRETLAMEVLDAAVDWLTNDGGDIALFDATNSTKSRRDAIAKRCPYAIVYVESICDDPDVLEQNMITKVSNSPDFKGLTFEAGLADLKERIANYEKAYETVEDDEGAYVKLFNFSSKVTANNCFGRMSKVVVPYLMAVHSNDRPIYLTALVPTKSEPEYLDDTEYKEEMQELDVADFQARLSKWWWTKNRSPCQLQTGSVPKLQVYTSTMPLAIDAGRVLMRPDPDYVKVTHCSALNPLLLGSAKSHPEIIKNVKERLDGGGSYLDLIHRLESTILDIEASVDPVLLVTHATPARLLRAYFKNILLDDVIGKDTTSPETQALADNAPAVLELRPKLGGGYTEKVHWI